MKTLFLCHPEQDYLEAMNFNGLCEVLGEDNVILYPPKLSYLGYADFTYLLHGQNKRGFTGTSPYIKPRRMRLYPLEEIIDEMPNIDLIVLSSPRHYPLHALRFIKQIYGYIPKNVAFIDGEDGADVRWDIIEEFKPKFIFKRELVQPIDGVHPLPFSAIVPHLDIYKEIEYLQKTLDIFALFGNTHEIRSRIVKFLLEQNYPNSYIGIDTGALPWQDDKRFTIPPLKGYYEYLRAMASAKINIVLRGHGRDTVRYWEVMSFASLMLVKDPEIIIPHPFENNVHCVYFDDIQDLKKKIEYYLSHENERIKIAKAGLEHCLKYHTNRARIENDFLPIIMGTK